MFGCIPTKVIRESRCSNFFRTKFAQVFLKSGFEHRSHHSRSNQKKFWTKAKTKLANSPQQLACGDTNKNRNREKGHTEERIPQEMCTQIHFVETCKKTLQNPIQTMQARISSGFRPRVHECYSFAWQWPVGV